MQKLKSSPHAGVLWSLLCIVLLTRLIVFGVNVRRDNPRFFVPDSFSYIQTAQSLYEHVGILDNAGRPDWGRVPAYPVLLALTYATKIASPQRSQGAVFVQCILGALVVLIAARLSRALPGNRGVLPVGLLLAMEPSAIAYSNLILSEMPYALALLLAFLAWERYLILQNTLSLLWFAAALGVLPLIRPIGQFFPLAVLPVLVWARWGRPGMLRAIVLFVLVAISPAAVWSWRNYSALGTFTLHSTGPWAQAIFAHDVERRIGCSIGPTTGDFIKPWESGFGYDQGLTPREIVAVQTGYFRDTVVAHPRAAAQQLVTTSLLLMGVPDSSLAAILLEHPPAVPAGSVRNRILWVAELGPLAPFVALGVVISLGGLVAIPGLLASWRRWESMTRKVLAFVVLTVIYHWAFASFVLSQGERYRVPIIPFLALLLTSGLGLLMRRRELHCEACATSCHRTWMVTGRFFRLSSRCKALSDGLVTFFRRYRERSGGRGEAVQAKSARVGGDAPTA